MSGKHQLQERSYIRSKKYLDKKLDEVTEMVKKVTIGETDLVRTTDESEMLGQLKEKFHETKESSVKIQILTVLPKSWSTRRIEREFGVSHHISQKVKSLVKVKGILSLPDPKPGHSLPQETADLVVAFYESDESSRMMPGKKGLCVNKRCWRKEAYPETTSFVQSKGALSAF